MQTKLLSLLSHLLPVWLCTIASAQSASPWSQVQKSGGEVLFLRTGTSAEIVRYDLKTRDWSEPVSLNSGPTALAADENFYYVGYDQHIERIHRSSGAIDHVGDFSTTLRWIPVAGQWLVVCTKRFNEGGEGMVVFRRSDLGHAGSVNYSIPTELRPVVHPSKAVFYVPDYDPYDSVNRGQISPDGTSIAFTVEFPGDGHVASQIWIWPDGSRVADNQGVVYNEGDLTIAGHLGSNIRSIAFSEDNDAFVLRTNRIDVYDPWLRLKGSLTPTSPLTHIFHDGDDLIGFVESSEHALGWEAIEIPITKFDLPISARALDPETLAYEVDATTVDDDGVLYLLSRDLRSIFRWDPREEEYLATIPLQSAATHLAYHPLHKRLYIYYPDGEITWFDLQLAEPRENPLAIAASGVTAIVPAGGELLASRPHNFPNLYVYERDGSLLPRNKNGPAGFVFQHAPSRRIFFNDNSIGYVEYLGDGNFGDPVYGMGGPYGEDLAGVSPDGSVVIGISGTRYAGDTMKIMGNLSNQVALAWWLDGKLFTFKGRPARTNYPLPAATTIQRWSDQYLPIAEAVLPGRFITAYPFDDEMVVATQVDEWTRFYRLDSSLTEISASALYPTTHGTLIVEQHDEQSVILSWNLLGINEPVLDLEWYDLASARWEPLDRVELFVDGYEVDGLQSGTHYDFRLASANKVQTGPTTTSTTVTRKITLSWEYFRHQNNLRLEERVAGEWQLIHQFDEESNPQEWALDEGARAPHTPLDFRLRYEDYLLATDPADLDAGKSIHFAWKRPFSAYDAFAVRLLDETGSVSETLALIDKETFTYQVPDDYNHLPLWRFQIMARSGDDAVEVSIRQRTITFDLDWTGAPGGTLGWLVESIIAEPYADREREAVVPITTTTHRLVYENARYNVDVRVWPITGTGYVDYPHPVRPAVETSVTWDNTNRRGTYIVLKRVSPDDPWEELRRYAEGGWGSIASETFLDQEPDLVPAYKIEEMKVDAPRVLAAVVVRTDGTFHPIDGITRSMKEAMGLDLNTPYSMADIITLERRDGVWIVGSPRAKSTEPWAIEMEWSQDLVTWSKEGVDHVAPTTDHGDYWREHRQVTTPNDGPFFIRFRVRELAF